MPYFEELTPGTLLPPLTAAPVTHNTLVRYSGASGDYNPLHTDPAVAQAAGYDTVIAHGMFVMGLLGRLVEGYVGPLALRRFSVRFRGVTRPGDVLTCSGHVNEVYLVGAEARISGEVQAADQHGDLKASGRFEAVVPLKQASV